MNERISIIVPVYNGEAYIRDCLISIVEQSYKNIDVLIVDDGSSDRTGKVVEETIGNDNRFSYLRIKHSGRVVARQEGFVKSSGDYVTFIDADDWFGDGAIEMMATAISQYGADIIECCFMMEYSTGATKDTVRTAFGYYDKARIDLEIAPFAIYDQKLGRGRMKGALCSKLIKRSLLDTYLLGTPIDVSVGEDTMVSFPCLLAAKSYVLIEAYLYHYRRHNCQTMAQYKPQLLRDSLTIYDHLESKYMPGHTDNYKLQISTMLILMARDSLLQEAKRKDNTLSELYDICKEVVQHPSMIKAWELISGHENYMVQKCTAIRRYQRWILDLMRCRKASGLWLMLLAYKVKGIAK